VHGLPDEFEPIIRKVGEIEATVKGVIDKSEQVGKYFEKISERFDELQMYKDEYIKLGHKPIIFKKKSR
jgi:hypothetical protein